MKDKKRIKNNYETGIFFSVFLFYKNTVILKCIRSFE